MRPKRSFARGASAYRRPRPVLPLSGNTFLIVTEGRKTEPNYLDGLRERLGLRTVQVEIVHPEGTDPLTLTRKAIELRDARKREARMGSSVAYDEVWVVLDLEEPLGPRRRLAAVARQLKGAFGIKFAESDPCFEFWLLLHFEYTTSLFTNCSLVIDRLGKHVDGYKKGAFEPELIIERLPDAVRHARRCREHHQACAGDGNPSTTMDTLVRELNSATRPHLRFLLE